MFKYDIIEALGQITREKNIDREFLLETLETGLLSAVRKKIGPEQFVEIKIDDISGDIEIWCEKTVVKEINNANEEITLRQARKIDPDVAIGETLKVLIPFEEFGRNAIQTVRQIVVQRIREAEREKVFFEYSRRVGEIVTGSVQQIDKGNVIVNLGKVEALMPPKSQIKKERFYQGDTIRAVVAEVLQVTKGPQVMISRTHDDFLRRLFELEVPEIYEGLVQIKGVAREPGHRAKIAVYSIDPRIDPIGACVGYKGSRVQTVVRELSGERIDIVPWHSDPQKFVANALSPAKITSIIVFAEQRKMTVIVDDDQLSLAIGKNGQNARLAAKLTDWKLDLLNRSQYDELLKEARAAETSLREMDNLDQELIDLLIENGYETVQDLENVLVDELIEIDEIDEDMANTILDAIDEMLDILDRQKAEESARADDDDDDYWDDDESEADSDRNDDESSGEDDDDDDDDHDELDDDDEVEEDSDEFVCEESDPDEPEDED